MFKRAQNTPLSSWAITDLTIIAACCYLPGLYFGSAAIATTKRSGHTVVVVVQVQMQNGTEETVFSICFLLGGLLACLLAQQLGQGHV